jgi:hypothetical protein
MAKSSIHTTTFVLRTGTTPVIGTVTYDSFLKKAIFVPSSILDYSTTYTLVVTSGVSDMAGIYMGADVQRSFTTEALCTSIPASPTGVAAGSAGG